MTLLAVGSKGVSLGFRALGVQVVMLARLILYAF